MPRIQLIHWNPTEAEARARRLEVAGYQVDFAVHDVLTLQRSLRIDLPAAVVIDLGRLPSQGRDIAVGLRAHASTRRVPIVFVGGDPVKVAQVRARLPDAVYTAWEEIEGALAQAIAEPPSHPLAMRSQMDGYLGKPLLTKLGIKPAMRVALLGAPPELRAELGEIPPGVELLAAIDGDCPLTLWFVRSRGELEEGMERIAGQAGKNALWIAWPKKGSPLAADVGEQTVRECGLAAGLVDYKICSIDATWSGLLFRRRKAL